jgi:hypothetical protein
VETFTRLFGSLLLFVYHCSWFRFDLFAAQYSFMGFEISQYSRSKGLRSRICLDAGLAGVAEGVGPTASAPSLLRAVWPARSFRRPVSFNRGGCRIDCRDSTARNEARHDQTFTSFDIESVRQHWASILLLSYRVQ